MNIQAALEAPRFTKKVIGGCDVTIEDRVAKDVRGALAAKGHKIELVGDFSADMGGGQAVIHDSATGLNWGASDPRKDGAAVPEPAAWWGGAAAPASPASGTGATAAGSHAAPSHK
jgi:gamma-glutamyltranspeptidase/glutathione hydrolase